MGYKSVDSNIGEKRYGVEQFDLRVKRSNLCTFCTYWIILTFAGANVATSKYMISLFYLSIEAVDFYRWKN
jgi:hypothetical protein